MAHLPMAEKTQMDIGEGYMKPWMLLAIALLFLVSAGILTLLESAPMP